MAASGWFASPHVAVPLAAGEGGAHAAVARFDDLRSGHGLVLVDNVDSRSATEVDEVVSLLEAAESHARQGCWVAVMVAYEAGAAFDPAFPRRLPPSGVPLAWFAACRSSARGEPLTRPRVAAVTDARRRGGTDWFMAGVRRCRSLIEEGAVYQINLTDRFDGSLVGTPFELYQAMATAQGGGFNAFLDLGDLAIVSASPELFVHIDSERVTVRPMKGTAARRPRSVDDERAGCELVGSVKDRAENVMIVDLMRNDLSRLAPFGGVSVPSLFESERYETVWQLTSTVQAEIDPEVTVLEVLRATFPCGSVTGAPKVAAMRYIDQIEPWPRGVYCGAIGLISPNAVGDAQTRPAATFSVAIRSAVVDTSSGTVEYGAGGGVTWGSVAAAEDAELESKAVVLTECRPEFQLLETLRVEGADPVNLEAHLRRMRSSAGYFGFDCDLDQARAACTATLATAPPMGARRMRILLCRDGIWNVELHPLAPTSTAPLRVAVATNAVRSDDVFCCHKTTNRAVYERVTGQHPGVDDVLLGNERGEITESCRANVLFRYRDEWFTPPLASGGLAGIARQQLLDSGDIHERLLFQNELAEVDEFALVSSLRGRRQATVLL